VDNPEHAASGSATLPLRGAEPGPGSVKAAPAARDAAGDATGLGSVQAVPWRAEPEAGALEGTRRKGPGPPNQVGAWGPRTSAPPGLGGSAAGVDGAFVGREAELADLTRAWEAAVARRPGLVLVAGEAGIGKTRLVGRWPSWPGPPGGLVVQARCYEAERSLFLQPVAEAVRAAALALPPARLPAAAGESAGTLAELVPELRRLLDLPAYERAPAELERRRSFEAVTAFVRGLAAQQPLLLALDDLHQAGASTLELLHFLLRRLAGDRLLVVATVRAEEGADALAALADVGRVLELGPLPAAASGSDYLLAQVAPPAQSRAAVDRIAAGLAPELRPAFLRRGRLAGAVAGR
jgi:AAA ATPase domain